MINFIFLKILEVGGLADRPQGCVKLVVSQTYKIIRMKQKRKTINHKVYF